MDFGAGFYLTSDLDQAARWAKLKKERTMTGIPMVSIFETDTQKWQDLLIQQFHSPNKEWLRYITTFRKGEIISTQFDVIIGPVADGQTIDTLGIYFRGLISAEIAIQLLLPHKLKDQYCLKTQKAIDSIRFSGVKKWKK